MSLPGFTAGASLINSNQNYWGSSPEGGSTLKTGVTPAAKSKCCVLDQYGICDEGNPDRCVCFPECIWA